MAGPPIAWDKARVVESLAETGSVSETSRQLDVNRSSLLGFMAREKIPSPQPKTVPLGAAKLTIEGDDATLITDASPTLGDLETLMRDRGLDPDEWVVVSTTLNQWEALANGGGEDSEPTVITLHQLKVSLKRRVALVLCGPAVHVPALAAPGKRKRNARDPDLIVLEGDHHAPYEDPDLDAAFTALVADLQPQEHIFGGDLGDYPTISRHADHPAAMASPQECVDASYHILRRRREVAPNAKAKLLTGNHDDRLATELLLRSERMHGLAPADEQIPATDMRRLLHLEALGIELVTDPRGWEHADIEIVPGRDGLVARHGFITGQNTARKTLDKVGRSVIYFHKHERAQHNRLSYPSGMLHTAQGAGAMCRNDRIHPHYTQEPDWHFGGVVVSRWNDTGQFHIEPAVWAEGQLFFRGRRY